LSAGNNNDNNCYVVCYGLHYHGRVFVISICCQCTSFISIPSAFTHCSISAANNNRFFVISGQWPTTNNIK
jgi:hypothetical protein